jgi:plastocyanin
MRGRRSRAARLAARLAVALVSLAAVWSCFSERTDADVTGPGGVCRIGVGSTVVGSVQAVVAMREFVYLPDTLRVPRGTVVTWVNCEEDFANEPHTATDDFGAWGSSEMSPTEIYSQRFDEPGVFTYFCEPHPWMRGALIVE